MVYSTGAVFCLVVVIYKTFWLPGIFHQRCQRSGNNFVRWSVSIKPTTCIDLSMAVKRDTKTDDHMNLQSFAS